MRVGPLEEGGATRVIQASALEDLPPVLERLTEDHRVENSGDRELLCLSLAPAESEPSGAHRIRVIHDLQALIEFGDRQQARDSVGP